MGPPRPPGNVTTHGGMQRYQLDERLVLTVGDGPGRPPAFSSTAIVPDHDRAHPPGETT